MTPRATSTRPSRLMVASSHAVTHDSAAPARVQIAQTRRGYGRYYGDAQSLGHAGHRVRRAAVAGVPVPVGRVGGAAPRVRAAPDLRADRLAHRALLAAGCRARVPGWSARPPLRRAPRGR